MPIRDLSDSVGLTFYGMAMVFKDTGRHRREDTARLCGPHGEARPFPTKTIKLLTAPKQKSLPAPYKFKLFGVEHTVTPAVTHQLKEIAIISTFPRPVAEIFASVAEGNIYMDDQIQWFKDEKRTKQARSLTEGALKYRDRESFQLAAEDSAVASGMMLSSMIGGGEEALEDRQIFLTAWSILTSIFDEQAFMEIVGEIRQSAGWVAANRKWEKSKDFWKHAFPQRRLREPLLSGLISIGDERADADKARCREAFEKRMAELARKARREESRQRETQNHLVRMKLLRQEVQQLTRLAR